LKSKSTAGDYTINMKEMPDVREIDPLPGEQTISVEQEQVRTSGRRINETIDK
jgi:hypothetical protein